MNPDYFKLLFLILLMIIVGSIFFNLYVDIPFNDKSISNKK